jgi:hypothetical protein
MSLGRCAATGRLTAAQNAADVTRADASCGTGSACAQYKIAAAASVDIAATINRSETRNIG